jgi:spore coat polysaccharide biosynthesis predicted glycosyltransferase SpsG
LNKNIIIRCDGGEIPNLGTGHVIRCVTICKYLIKNYGFKKKNFIFLIKTKKKFKIGKKILDLERFNYKNFPNNIKDFSLDEVNIIKKFNPKLVLIDRLGFVSKKYLSI